MTKLKLGVIALSLMFIAFSCKKDDDNNDSNPTLKELSVSEGKGKIEDSGIEMLNTLDDFRSDEAMVKIKDLSDYMDANMNTSSTTNMRIFNYFVDLSAAIKSGLAIQSCIDLMRRSNVRTSP